MPSWGGVSDFDVVLIGARPAGEAAAQLGTPTGTCGYKLAPGDALTRLRIMRPPSRAHRI